MHVSEHCATPRITRHWKRLGEGAAWICSCGQIYRLEIHSGYDVWFVWEKIQR